MTTDYLKKFGLTAPRKNPAPRIGTAKPKRPSQATGKPPSKRLVSRRKKNTVKGTFPNPTKRAARPASQTWRGKLHIVEMRESVGGPWKRVAAFKSKAQGEEYAKALFKRHDCKYSVRVDEHGA